MRALSFLLAAALVTGCLTAPSSAQRITRVQKEKPPVELDWLVRGEELWNSTPDDLEKKFGSRKFVWQDKERTRARFNPDKFKLKLMETEVGETLVSFKGGRISGVTFSVLNKGDDDEIINLTRFNTATEKLKTIIGGVSGVKEEARKKEEMVSKNAGGAVWRGKKAFYLAEWLFLPEKKEDDGYWIIRTPAHGEFVRLRVLPPMVQLGVQGKQAKATATKATLAANVKREGKSAIIQNVPMVDQGSKGYCAVASFERVLRLYGVELDMHDLANLAETYGGTNPMKMKEAVFKVAQKLGMNTREPIFLKGKQYESLFKEYNKIARQKGMSEIDLEHGAKWEDVDPETLKATRLKEGDYAKFRQEVVASINKGIPVMWALRLGLFWEDQLEDSFEANRFAVTKDEPAEGEAMTAEQEKEAAEQRKKEMEEMRKNNPRPPAYMGGGHLRLIVGYDADKQLIYYSDSWGPGHEMKSMPIEQAYTCTLALFVIAPQ